MRILVLNYEYPPLGGGASPVTAAQSVELASRGHQLDVVTMAYEGLPAYEEVGGVHIHRVPCRRSRKEICRTAEMATYLLPGYRKAVSLATEQPYDLIHAHFIFPTGVMAAAVKRKLRVPLVITSHGSDIPGHNPSRFQLEHRLAGPLWRHTVAAADCVVSPSQHLADKLTRAARGAPEVRVIPYGVRELPYEPQRKIPNRVLMVGRLLDFKGFRTMLRALRHGKLDLELHIVGDGPDRKTLEEMAEPLETPVIFHGWLDNRGAEYRELYATSRFFVFPSQMESFGMVLAEAMTAGLCILTSARGACGEVAGDTAQFIDPDDDRELYERLSELLADPARASRMGAAARERAISQFTWSSAADAYEGLFAELLQGHGRSAT